MGIQYFNSTLNKRNHTVLKNTGENLTVLKQAAKRYSKAVAIVPTIEDCLQYSGQTQKQNDFEQMVRYRLAESFFRMEDYRLTLKWLGRLLSPTNEISNPSLPLAGYILQCVTLLEMNNIEALKQSIHNCKVYHDTYVVKSAFAVLFIDFIEAVLGAKKAGKMRIVVYQEYYFMFSAILSKNTLVAQPYMLLLLSWLGGKVKK